MFILATLALLLSSVNSPEDFNFTDQTPHLPKTFIVLSIHLTLSAQAFSVCSTCRCLRSSGIWCQMCSDALSVATKHSGISWDSSEHGSLLLSLSCFVTSLQICVCLGLGCCPDLAGLFWRV